MVDWTGADEDQADVNVWEDNWDDDNVEDDFSQQLRSVAYNTCWSRNMKRRRVHLFGHVACPSLSVLA